MKNSEGLRTERQSICSAQLELYTLNVTRLQKLMKTRTYFGIEDCIHLRSSFSLGHHDYLSATSVSIASSTGNVYVISYQRTGRYISSLADENLVCQVIHHSEPPLRQGKACDGTSTVKSGTPFCENTSVIHTYRCSDEANVVKWHSLFGCGYFLGTKKGNLFFVDLKEAVKS